MTTAERTALTELVADYREREAETNARYKKSATGEVTFAEGRYYGMAIAWAAAAERLEKVLEGFEDE